MDTISLQTGTFKSFDDSEIYYEIRGEGSPIVMIYGIACLMNHWHHQINYFSKTHKVITFDLRGHHKSASITNLENLNFESISQDIFGLLNHLKLPRAHFMGHSFGVPALLDFYSRNPDMVTSMVFINGFASNPIKGMFGLEIIEPLFYFIKDKYWKQQDLWKTLWKVTIDNPMAMYVAALAGGFNLRLTHFKDIEVYVRGVSGISLDVFITLFEEMMKFDREDILPEIKIPTLIISGEKDNVTPVKFQYKFRDLIPNSEFVLVPYGSHCTQLDFPDYTNLKIEKFYSEIKK